MRDRTSLPGHRLVALGLMLAFSPRIFSQAPTVVSEETSQAVDAASPSSLTVTATGAAPLAFQWYERRLDGSSAPVVGATNPTLSLPAPTASQAYFARVTNASGACDSPATRVLPWLAHEKSRPASNLGGASYANGRYFVFGTDGGASSPDGVSWSSLRGGTVPPNAGKVAYGNGVYVAGGGTAAQAIYVSNDGHTWASRASGQDGIVARVLFNGTRFVAVGDGDGISTSENGQIWTPRSASSSLYDLAIGGGLHLAVGARRIARSTDGLTWTATSAPTDVPFHTIVYGGGRFTAFANGERREAWTTIDGSAWSQIDYPSCPPLPNGQTPVVTDAAFGGGTFVAVAGPHVMLSDDGITWATTPGFFSHQTSSPASIAYGNGRFLFAGEAGVVALSLPIAGVPTIAAQCAERFVLPGETTSLSIAATGTNLTYQWYRGTTGDVSRPLPDATNPTLTTPAATHDESYWVRVAGGSDQVESATIPVRLATPPAVATASARDIEVPSGQPLTLIVRVNGTPAPKVQWFRGAPGDTSAPVSGATRPMLTLNAGSAIDRYWLRATNIAGTADSVEFQITPLPPVQAIGVPLATASPQTKVSTARGASTTTRSTGAARVAAANTTPNSDQYETRTTNTAVESFPIVVGDAPDPADTAAQAPAKTSVLQNAAHKVLRVFYGGTSIENMSWSWGYHLRESLMRAYGDSGNRTIYTVHLGGTSGQYLGWYKQQYGGLTFYRLRGTGSNTQGLGGAVIAPLVFTSNVREFVLHYSTEADGGTATILIDGAPPAHDSTINCNGPQSYNHKAVYSFPAPGLHSITVSAPGSGYCYFETLDLNLNNPGIHFIDGSLGGSSINHMCSPPSVPPWQSNRLYGAGSPVADPTDGHMYAASTNVSSATPPHSDPANWQQTGEDPSIPQADPLIGVRSYMLDTSATSKPDLILFGWVVNDAGSGADSVRTYYKPALTELVNQTTANGQQLVLVAEMGGSYLVSGSGGLIDPNYAAIVTALKSYAAQPNVTFLDWNAATKPPMTTVLGDWQAFGDRYYNSHALLYTATRPGDTSIVVDDASSVVAGVTLTIDPGANQETVAVANTYSNLRVPGGWVVPLATALTGNHAANVPIRWGYALLTVTSVGGTPAFTGNWIHPNVPAHAIAYAMACAALNVPSDGNIGDTWTNDASRLLAADPALHSVAATPPAAGQPAGVPLPVTLNNLGVPDGTLRSVGQSVIPWGDAGGGNMGGVFDFSQSLWTSTQERNLFPYWNSQIARSGLSDESGKYINVANTAANSDSYPNLDGKTTTWTMIVGPGAFGWQVRDGGNAHNLVGYINGAVIPSAGGRVDYAGVNTTDRPIVVHCTVAWEGTTARLYFGSGFTSRLYGVYVTATAFPCVTTASANAPTIGPPVGMVTGSDLPLVQVLPGQVYFETVYDRNNALRRIHKRATSGRVRKPDGNLYAYYDLLDSFGEGLGPIRMSLDGTTSYVPGNAPAYDPILGGYGVTTDANPPNPNSSATPITPHDGAKWTVAMKMTAPAAGDSIVLNGVIWHNNATGAEYYWNELNQSWDTTYSGQINSGAPGAAVGHQYQIDIAHGETLAITVKFVTAVHGADPGYFRLGYYGRSNQGKLDADVVRQAEVVLVPGSSAGF